MVAQAAGGDSRSRAFLDLLATRENPANPAAATTAASAPSVNPLAAIAADSADYTAPFSADDMASFARRLQSTLISYWTTQDALYIIVVDQAGKFAGVRVKVGREKLRRMVARTLNASEQLGFAPTEKTAPGTDSWQKLYNILIEPIAAFLPRKRGSLLAIIPHGPLFRLPFCALQDRNGHYLLERYATYYLPAAAVLQFTEQNEKKALQRQEHFLLVSYGGPPGPAGRSVSRAKERYAEPRGTVRFLSIKAAGCDGALAQLNLKNSPTHHRSRIGNEKRPIFHPLLNSKTSLVSGRGDR
jgi:CHAT domain-containing protein